jgi:hypothetical protein
MEEARISVIELADSEHSPEIIAFRTRLHAIRTI